MLAVPLILQEGGDSIVDAGTRPPRGRPLSGPIVSSAKGDHRPQYDLGIRYATFPRNVQRIACWKRMFCASGRSSRSLGASRPDNTVAGRSSRALVVCALGRSSLTPVGRGDVSRDIVAARSGMPDLGIFPSHPLFSSHSLGGQSPPAISALLSRISPLAFRLGLRGQKYSRRRCAAAL